MKKITLLFFLVFLSFSGYSQMALEGFESTSGPNALPSTVWPLGTGNWAVFDNGVGTGQRWGINNTVATPPLVYAGTNAAYMNRENIGQNNTSEDYLATPLVTIPNNGQLRFFTRSFTNGNQGTMYQIKIAPATANQTDPAAYTLVQEFTEDQLSAVFNVYEEKIVDLPASTFNGQYYVAFVMKYAQPNGQTGIGGDRWLVDDARITPKCVTPVITAFTNPTLTGGTLTWSNPSGATAWDLEVILATANPTGTVTHTAGPTPTITFTNLQPSTAYKVYIRAQCSPAIPGDPTVSSAWTTTAYNITTASPGLTCVAPVIVPPTLPYVTNANTLAFGDTTDVAQPLPCAGTATNYMTGNDVFYSYTADVTGPITVTMTPTGNGTGVFMYQGCANVGVTCIAGAANTGGGPRILSLVNVVAGQTYIIVVSSNAAVQQTFAYNLTIVRNSCTNLVANFAKTSNCTGTSSGFFVTADVTSFGTATSVVATDNQSSPAQTITAPGLITFGPYPNGTNVTLHLENGTDANCFINSASFTQQFCPFTNDLCANAIPVTCGSNEAQTTVGATTTGAPTGTCGTTAGSGGLWYSYLGNGDIVTASLCNSTFDTRLQVVTGSCGTFTCVGGNDNSCANQSVFSFITTPGVTYYIYVYGTGAAQGVFTLNITCVTPPPPPVNDNCDTATVVPVNTDGSCAQTVNGTVVGALASSQPNACVGTADDDVWYQFTATATSHIIQLTNIAGSTTDLNFAVYSSTNQASPCGALTQILCSNPNLSVATGLTVGNVYLIRVYTAINALSQTTTFTLCVSTLPPVPANDNCANAIVAPINVGVVCTQTVNGYTTSATASSDAVGTGCGGGAAANDDVWYQFTATQTTHLISLSNIVGTVTNMYHAVYSGTCGALTQRYCSDPDNSTATGLVVGQTYYIRIYTASTAANEIASFTLCIGSILPPVVTNSTTYTNQGLIEDVFLGSPCASVSNITSQTGVGADTGIGYFTAPTGSFPFTEGIVLATRPISTVPGPNGAVAPPAGTWGGDAQLFNYIQTLGIDPGLTSYNNASKLEFDFIPIDSGLTFDFIFASDEYGTFQCDYSDAFAFFLTDLSTGVTTNLAIVPGVVPATPIAVTTIRDVAYNAACTPGSVNAQFFGQFYGTNGINPLAAPIDFNGVTVPMQATATVTPNQQYHIKMVIADRNDSAFDSAIFLKAGSLDIGQIELGQNFLEADGTALCTGESYTLQSGLDPTQYIFTWQQNGTTIPGETGPNLVVTTTGIYTISASYITGTCTSSDSVTIEFYAPVAGGTPNTLSACNSLGFAQFDLSTNNAAALGSLSPTANTVSYFETLLDAQSGTATPLPTLYTNTTAFTQTIYVRVQNNVNGCYTTSQFNLNVQAPPVFTVTPDFSICAGTTGTISVTPTNFNLNDATYAWTLDGNALAATTPIITVSQAGTYVVTVSVSGCTEIGTTVVTVTALPAVDTLSPVVQCTPYTLLPLTNGTYYTGTGGTGPTLSAGDVISSSQTLYIFAQTATNPICYSESIFSITITPQIVPTFTQLGPYCQFDTPGTLPTTSGNGISGTWNPPTVSTATAGTTTYTFTPTTTLCNGNVTMTIVVNAKPVLPSVAPVVICDSYTLPALPANVSYNTASNGSGTTLAQGSTITTSQLIYVYGTSGTTPNCTTEDSFTVTITQTPQFEIEGGCDGNFFVLEAIPLNGSYDPATVNYSWTNSSNIEVGTQSTYTATTNGIYTLTITAPSINCSDSHDFNAVQTACVIQKGISPNGDGSNDSLDLTGFNVKELSIYNRYGSKVYSKTSYTNQWYGQTDKGDELPDGTYYFVIERNDGPTKSGWVYINRVN